MTTCLYKRFVIWQLTDNSLVITGDGGFCGMTGVWWLVMGWVGGGGTTELVMPMFRMTGAVTFLMGDLVLEVGDTITGSFPPIVILTGGDDNVVELRRRFPTLKKKQ